MTRAAVQIGIQTDDERGGGQGTSCINLQGSVTPINREGFSVAYPPPRQKEPTLSQSMGAVLVKERPTRHAS